MYRVSVSGLSKVLFLSLVSDFDSVVFKVYLSLFILLGTS